MKDTYNDEIKTLARMLEWNDEIYRHVPATREIARVRPLTAEDRMMVEAKSTERGYRRIVADHRNTF